MIMMKMPRGICSTCKFRESGYSSPSTAAFILMMRISIILMLMQTVMSDADNGDNDVDDADDGDGNDVEQVHEATGCTTTSVAA